MKLVTRQRFASPIHNNDFNPHEREARDKAPPEIEAQTPEILIHTSVKLVTRRSQSTEPAPHNFNPHEREARDLSCTTDSTPVPYFNPHEREARDVLR